jgi:hypothetical protein
VGAGALIDPVAGFILFSSGCGVLAWYYGGGILGIVPTPTWVPWWRLKVSRIHKHGLLLSVHYHWDDESFGKPSVVYDQETNRLTWVWAMLDIEVRNTSNEPVRLSDLYMEIRRERLPRKMIAIAEPASVGSEHDWYKRPNRRRVEWLLEPHSPAMRTNIDFLKNWAPDEASVDPPKNCMVAIVAELEGGVHTIRLPLADDILGAA